MQEKIDFLRRGGSPRRLTGENIKFMLNGKEAERIQQLESICYARNLSIADASDAAKVIGMAHMTVDKLKILQLIKP